MYEKYIDEFVFSEEMREYLKKTELPADKITDLIYYSPKPLAAKLKALEELQILAATKHDNELLEHANRCVRNIDDAYALLHTEGVFTIEECYYDDHVKEEMSCLETICATYEEVSDYISCDLELSETIQDWNKWIVASKWIKDENGKYKRICEYFFVQGEIWYINVDRDFYQHIEEHMDFYMLTNLNLPVPFHVGDYVEIEGFPFGPRIKMLFLEIGDNRDCCCLQGLTRDADGLWHIGAVKHGMMVQSYYPQISPLYSIRTYNENRTEDDILFLRVQKYLNGEETKGHLLWERICGNMELTDQRLIEILGELEC